MPNPAGVAPPYSLGMPPPSAYLCILCTRVLMAKTDRKPANLTARNFAVKFAGLRR